MRPRPYSLQKATASLSVTVAFCLLPCLVSGFVAPERAQEEHALIQPIPMILEVPVQDDIGQGLLPDDTPWTGFKAAHPGTWHRRLDLRTGRPALIWGRGIPWVPGNGNSLAPSGPTTTQQLDVAARELLAENPGLFRVDPGHLAFDSESSAGLTDGSLWFVNYNFQPHGIPALYAGVFFRVNHGNLIQMGSRGIIDPEGLPFEPRIGREEALKLAQDRVGKVVPGPSRTLDEGTLVYLPQASNERAYFGEPGQGLTYRLTWKVSFRQEGRPETWVSHVDARTGTILALYDANAYACDPAALQNGKVKGGVFAVQPADPEIVRAFPFTLVREDGNPVVTDFNGIYPYQGGTATSGLNGPYFDMNCSGCTDPEQAFRSDSLSGDLDFGTGGLDALGNGFSTRPERNTFYHLSLVRAMGAKWLSIPWFNQSLAGNVNLAGSCNAFFNGGSVNFLLSDGTCNNTGELSGVIYHEWGHGLDSRTNYGGDGARGEGIGDILAFHIDHNSRIGAGFRKTGGGVRNVDENTSSRGLLTVSNVGSQCPGGSGPLGYEVHCEGEIIGQTIWRLAQNLVAGYGDIAGWYISERLFFGSLLGSTTYLGDQAGGMYDAYVAADDDDGNLNNGIPHAGEINDAFVAHEVEGTSLATQSTPCTPPAGPVITAIPLIDPTNGVFQVDLTWTAVTGASFYNVYRNEKSRTGAYVPIATNLAVRQWVDENVTNGITYYYVVLAVDASACVSTQDNAVSVVVDLAELAVESFQIDDGALGNGNNALDPGEQVTLPLTLINLGAGNTTGVTATLSTTASFATVLQGTASFGTINGNGLGSSAPPHFTFAVTDDAANCEKEIPFVISVESSEGCWLDVFSVPVGNGLTDVVFDGFVVDDTVSGNANGVLDPGEQIDLIVSLANVGALTARNVTAQLSTSNGAVVIAQPSAGFGDIPFGAARDSLPPQFSVTVLNFPFLCGEVVDFDLTVFSDDGCWTESFSIQLGMGGPIQTIYFDDFEGAATQWRHGANYGVDSWQRGSMGIGRGREPDRAYSGDKCWGTDLGNDSDGEYDQDTMQWLESPALDFTAYQTVFLNFKRWLGVEEATYDQARVLVNGIEVWKNQSGLAHIDTSWVDQEINVTAQAAGKSGVVLRFELASDGGLQFGGWNIDDVHFYSLDCELPAPRPQIGFVSSSVDDGIVFGAGNQDAVLDPGELPTLIVDLTNVRNSIAMFVEATLSLETPIPGVSITDNRAAFPDIAPNDVETSLAPHFGLSVAETAVCGQVVAFLIDMTYQDGNGIERTDQARFSHRIGSLGAVTGPEEPIFFDDMESGKGEWRHGLFYQQDDWQHGIIQGNGGFDPSNPYSGGFCWGNDLGMTVGGTPWNGNYFADTYNWLDSPVIDCTIYENVKLRYRRWLTVEDGVYDHARIRVNGTVVWENPAGPGDVDFIDVSWTEHEIDISALADRNGAVQVRFELETDPGKQLGGWNVDDFGLYGVPRERLCTPFDCVLPLPAPVGASLRASDDGSQVLLAVPGYTGGARLFSLYRTQSKPALAALGPGELYLTGVGESLLLDPDLWAPGITYYQVRAQNDCGDEEP